jgi:hypothetical protein
VNAFWNRRLWREPDGGNLHVRFDEGEGSGGHWSSDLSSRALLSTLPVMVLERRGEAGRQGDIVRELAGDFVVYERFFAEPADRANDEQRGQVAVSIERHGRAPRHGSSWSFGHTERHVNSSAHIELEIWEGPLTQRERLPEATPQALREALLRLDGNRTDCLWIEFEDVGALRKAMGSYPDI